MVSKHFIEDVALGRVGVATEDRTSQLGGSDGMLPENFERLDLFILETQKNHILNV